MARRLEYIKHWIIENFFVFQNEFNTDLFYSVDDILRLVGCSHIRRQQNNEWTQNTKIECKNIWIIWH